MAKIGDSASARCRQCDALFDVIVRRGPRPLDCYSCRPLCKVNDNRERQRLHRLKLKIELPAKRCDHCQDLFKPKAKDQRFCAPVCRSAFAVSDKGREEMRERCKAHYWSKRSKAGEKPCAECGKVFLPWRSNISYCSKECETKQRWRKSSSIRRARIKGAVRERFDPVEVFERDGWRCHLCGVKTLPHLRGTNRQRAPQLDHIVPLSKGGEHTRLNTACSCRKCNMSKLDRVIGQPSLFAA